jgi:hypothetical protein
MKGYLNNMKLKYIFLILLISNNLLANDYMMAIVKLSSSNFLSLLD